MEEWWSFEKPRSIYIQDVNYLSQSIFLLSSSIESRYSPIRQGICSLPHIEHDTGSTQLLTPSDTYDDQELHDLFHTTLTPGGLVTSSRNASQPYGWCPVMRSPAVPRVQLLYLGESRLE